MDRYELIKNEIKETCSKSLDEIKKEFSNNLISANIHSNFYIPNQYEISDKNKNHLRKKFNSSLGLTRRKIERASFAYINGEYFLLTDDYLSQTKYLKLDEDEKKSKKSSKEISLSDYVEEVKKEIVNYYLNKKVPDKKTINIINDIEDKTSEKIYVDLGLIVRPFPDYFNNQYDFKKINDDMKVYAEKVVLETYKQAKESYMTKQYINGENIIDIMEKHKDFIFHDTLKLESINRKKNNLTKDELLAYYKENNITSDMEVIEELERNSLLYYYYKLSAKEQEEDKVKSIIRSKVLDGARTLYRRANKLYEMTGDNELYEQIKNLEKFKSYLEE
ncbi:hypothetical protein [Brassicibacter mesophilus]|uniref:hypothetical protein n=1 Tax=Brassicibacter mesophilus TaxID=745119 RepID=UPI003D1F0EE9